MDYDDEDDYQPASEIQRITIKPFTILVTRNARMETLYVLAQSLPADTIVLNLIGDESIEKLDEADMRRYGWVRANDF